MKMQTFFTLFRNKLEISQLINEVRIVRDSTNNDN
jgi:hypothetical protein